MSTKPKRHRHHKKPKKHKASGVEGNMASDASGVDPNQPTGRATNTGSQPDQTPSIKPRRPDWMTIFTGILAIFAFLSFVALVIQLKDARESFIKDQRPYVWIANSKDSLSWGVNKPSNQIWVSMHFTNFGKSPAIAVQQSYSIETGADAYFRIKSTPLRNPKNILPTGKEDFFSVASSPLTDKQLEEISAIPAGGIVVLTRWQYLDLSGNRFETELCMGRLNSNAWAYCESHNEIRDCSKVECAP